MSPRTLQQRLPEHRRRLVALVLVALLVVPVLQAANRLRVHVDGDVVEVLSFDATVADLLDREGVELAAGDEVLPHPATPLAAVDSITILRTIGVTLVVDGEAQQQRGTWRTVEGLLADVGIDPAPDTVVRPGPRTLLDDGDTVTVDAATAVTVVAADGSQQQLTTHLDTVGELLHAVEVDLAPGQQVRPAPDQPLPDTGRVVVESPVGATVVADGRTRTVDSFRPTVGALLDELGIRVGRDDLVQPPPATALADGIEVVVRRVTFEEVVEEVAIPHETEQRDTDDLHEGDSRVAQEGSDGVMAQTHRVRRVDGEEVDRELLDEEVVSEPVTRIVENGTKARPQPPAPSGDSVWYDLARCESGGRWDYDGASGYDGGLQFHPDTWRRNAPPGYPEYAHQATPAQQIEVGRRVQARAGWDAWPSCAARLGLS